MSFQGVYSVLPTPFRDDGSLDLGGLARVVDLYVEAGLDGVTALGVTSEVAKLTGGERDKVLECVLAQVNGKVPVIAGASADGLVPCIELAKRAEAMGAAGVLVRPARMAAPNPGAAFAHYAGLASAVDMEIVVQDYPPFCGFTMEPALLARIAREIPRAGTLKLEDPPTPAKTARILEACPGADISILGGLGGVYLFEELLAGAKGVMTGFAYPEMLVEVVELFQRGEIDQAADRFYRYVPLMRFEFQQGIGVALRKEILRRRGAISNAISRAPGSSLDAATLRSLDTLLLWMRNQGVKWISA